ncbi:hypothetical protein EJ05DRAFT_477353 [Pseudovirgaria hyperparasitica]|uniref:GAT domain-containing protein n=1 Tax=Pseudovirgaria hyperparasitica TaxID=470096 RepID=A0A6A6W4N2_9PEZI|nr:uncharacterized protein EJ05DRAFT_477353 [Pseudovirgaria hyperparasitica]KAF2757129.1 hypothetical protein EJ05DRAFT_477353 [Pseudovirgaria hyperparasitica]
MMLKRISTLIRGEKAGADDASQDKNSPEAQVVQGVKSFCESASANSGEEVLHLPTIVENAVASPQAAGAAANQIRKFLSEKYNNKPSIQYNAIMLIRILADNPGPSFTKNLDQKFTDAAKQLLRNGRDPSVNQILRETLDALEREKAYDTNLNTLFAMWRREMTMTQQNPHFGNRAVQQQQQAFNPGSQHGSHRSRSRTLPPPTELAARIEEARTSAKLLLQLVQSTPPNEVFSNDLIKEFADRCQSAHKSIQGYINCDSPPPDDDTMLTLIETNEQLSLAASKHQRAVLAARRALGMSPSPNNSGVITPLQQISSPPPQQEIKDLPHLPPVIQTEPIMSTSSPPPLQQPKPQHAHQAFSPSLQTAPQHQPADGSSTEDPFSDDAYAAPTGPPPAHAARLDEPPVTDYTEPYHPGYGAQQNGDPGYGAGADTVSTMGAETRMAPATGEVSPIAERQTTYGNQTYRY